MTLKNNNFQMATMGGLNNYAIERGIRKSFGFSLPLEAKSKNNF